MNPKNRKSFMEAGMEISKIDPPFTMKKLYDYFDKRKKYQNLKERAEVGSDEDRTKLVLWGLNNEI